MEGTDLACRKSCSLAPVDIFLVDRPASAGPVSRLNPPCVAVNGHVWTSGCEGGAEHTLTKPPSYAWIRNLVHSPCGEVAVA